MSEENKEFSLPPIPKNSSKFAPPPIPGKAKASEKNLYIIAGSVLAVVVLCIIVGVILSNNRSNNYTVNSYSSSNNGLKEGEVGLRDSSGNEYGMQIDEDYYSSLGTESSNSYGNYSGGGYSGKNRSETDSSGNSYSNRNYISDTVSEPEDTQNNSEYNSGYISKDNNSSLSDSKLTIGDIIAFGKYNWKVLDIKDNTALITTEYVIFNMQYNNVLEDITWENSSIRKYLNNEFYNSFSENDKEKVIEVTNLNLDNPQYKTRGGNSTIDKVFLLSIDEYNKYYNYMGIPKYVLLNVVWWLRSPGEEKTSAAGLYDCGILNTEGYYVDGYGGVRPALWMKLDS